MKMSDIFNDMCWIFVIRYQRGYLVRGDYGGYRILDVLSLSLHIYIHIYIHTNIQGERGRESAGLVGPVLAPVAASLDEEVACM